ncbi:MAG: RNA ligase [Candidatus Micrarchaeota archaeon]
MQSELLKKALERGKVEKKEEELGYLRFIDDFSGVPRGTVIVGTRVIWGFPHIPRIFTLEEGVKRNIKDKEVYLEEKIDGYNLRIARIKGKVYAFSRGGFLDSFSTEKARGMRLDGFFNAKPRHILCGEMIGNTPYTKPSGKYDVKLLVFDIMREDGDFLQCASRHELLKKFGIEGVPFLGKFRADDGNSLKRVALSLNKSNKEGMVIKAADRKTVVKYVTPNADIEDIANGAAIYLDMPPGFFYQRVLRSGIFMKDFALEQEKFAKKLGEAFYSGLMKALKETEKGEEASEEFEILIKDPAVWQHIRNHMSHGVHLEEVFRREEEGGTRIRFLKKYKKTSRLLKAYLHGKGITD